MKFLTIFALIFSLFSLSSCQEKTAVSDTQTNVKPKKFDPLEREEDCDEKAKKPVEIIPEAVSLSGAAGCTLDEVNP